MKWVIGVNSKHRNFDHDFKKILIWNRVIDFGNKKCNRATSRTHWRSYLEKYILRKHFSSFLLGRLSYWNISRKSRLNYNKYNVKKNTSRKMTNVFPILFWIQSNYITLNCHLRKGFQVCFYLTRFNYNLIVFSQDYSMVNNNLCGKLPLITDMNLDAVDWPECFDWCA